MWLFLPHIRFFINYINIYILNHEGTNMTKVHSTGITVSVVCITYNHGKYIRNALDSFLIQDYQFEVEFIISDDCSTDNTVEILNEYEDRFKGTLKIISNKTNLGFMKNFINAMNSAVGKYIAICEGDDFWCDPLKLEVQVDAMELQPDVDISFHSSKIINSQEIIQNKLFCHRGSDGQIFHIKDIIASSGCFMPTASLMLKRSAYTKFSPPIMELYQRYTTAFFTQLLFTSSQGALYINTPMSVYRIMGEGSWTESVVNDINAFIHWNKLYIDAVKSYDQLTEFKYHESLINSIADKHFSILKNASISIKYKRIYFSEHRHELLLWQIIIWKCVIVLPGNFLFIRKIKKILSRTKTIN